MTDTALPSGIDLQWVDKEIRPQDDLFGHVNGKWLNTHEIPADRSQDGAFHALRDQAEIDVREIVEESAKLPGADAARIADLYASFMNTERIEADGIEPLQPLLSEIASINDKDQLAKLLGRSQRNGLVALFGSYINTDAKDSSRYIIHLTQSGLGLPDESFYKEDAYEEIRKAYGVYLTRLAELVGLDDPANIAETVMDLETAIANVSWDRVTDRDAVKTYNLMSLVDVEKSAPDFPWSQWFGEIGAKKSDAEQLVVRQPSFVTDAAKLWAERPLAQWKAWLQIRTAAACAPYLNDEIVEHNFDFYGRTLSGTPQLRERWKRGVALVEGALGEAVGQIYVSQHFAPSSKDRMEKLVANLVEAYRQSIGDLDWMGAETRERALKKLAQFTPKIGYPNKWKDYSALEIKPDDLLGNVARASAWGTDHELDKLGKPVDRDEWHMTPQTVNAYYNPHMNEIVFPAAILQPPFFNPDADDAANYGGIGAVIGHEIGHGFDDQGSRFDGEGNLVDWWEESDRSEFEQRTSALIEQFDQLSPRGLAEHKINGAFTIGENIGDLGGLAIAIKAYRLSLNGNESPVIDGLSGIQRLFFGWAQVWRAITRDEEAIRRLTVDPHSPPDQRCNAIASNLDAFHEAFDVTDKDALFRPSEQRVRIW